MAEPSVDELLDDAPLSRLHLRVWSLSAMGIMLDGFDFFIVGVAIPLLRVQFDASALEIGLVSAAAVIGAIVGASTLGPLTDRLGRKTIFLVDLAMFVLFAAGSALAWSIWALILFRFLLGICIGADYPIAASYLVEVSPKKQRTRLLVAAFALQAAGQVLGAVVGLMVLQVTDDVGAWRWMFAAGIPPAILVVLLRLGVPESPRWLAAKGRFEEAAAVTARFVQRTVSPEQMRSHRQEVKVPYRSLFGPALRRRTILCSFPWFLMDIATYGVGVFTPTILAALAFTGDGTYLADDIASTEGAAVLDVFLVVGFGLAILLINRVGKVRLQVFGFGAMAIGLAVLATASTLPGGGNNHLVLVFGGFAIFNLFMNMGPNSTTFLLPAEAFPTDVRASGHGFATACGKSGAALGLLLFPFMQGALGLATTLVVIAAGCLIAGAATFVLRAAAEAPAGGRVSVPAA